MGISVKRGGRSVVRFDTGWIGYSIHQRDEKERAKQPTQKLLRFGNSPRHPS